MTVLGNSRSAYCRSPLAFAVLAGAILVASCVGDSLTPMQRLGDTRVSLGAIAFTEIGDSARVPVIGNGVSLNSIVWSTADPTVATVDQGGVVHAVSAGTTYVKGRLGRWSDSAQVTVAPVATKLVVSPETDTLFTVGSTVNLNARFYDRNGKPAKGPAPQWLSLNRDVATVDSTGRVTAVQSGKALVTATSGLLADTATVLVIQQIASISVTPTSATLTAGQTLDLSASALDARGNVIPSAMMAWASSAPAVATVSGGKVTAVSIGTAQITASSGGKSGAASIVVSGTAVASVQVTPSSSSLAVGNTTQLTAQAVDASGNAVSGVALSWTSSNTAVATVSSSGLVKAVNAGNATITASTGTQSGTSAVAVSGAPAPVTVSALTVSPSSAMLDVGAALQLSATVTDAAGNVLTGRTITWSSASPAVATVSSTGVVSGVAAGQTTITATCEGKSSTVSVTVQAPVASVVVTPSPDTLTVGGSKQLSAIVKDNKGNVLTGRTITWRSLAPAIASVSVTGLVTALATGNASVTATVSGVTGDAAVTVLTAAAAPAPGTSGYVVPALPQVLVDSRYVAPTGQVISVAAGGDLQAALNAAQPGGVVELPAGPTYTGNFTLPAKGGSSYIIVRSSAWASLPAEGTRVGPANAGLMARIVSPNAMPALRAASRSSYWRIMGLEVVGQPTSTTYIYSILEMQPSSVSSVSDYPNHIVLDRVYVHPAADATNVQRCVTMNAAYAAVVDSYLAGCHYQGTDAQAIVAWDSPGPLKIVNNYLEGSGENVMFGGAASSIIGLVPSDIEIRHNYFFKPLSWQGSAWAIKNLFEIKSARRILVEGNIFENNWVQAQTGTAILLRSGPDGGCTWCVMEDLTFRYNIVKNSPKGLSVIGVDGTQVSKRVLIQNNVFDNVGDPTKASGEFWIFTIFNGPQDVTFDHNTVPSGSTRTLLMFADPARYLARGFTFTNNIADLGDYGVFGDGSIVVPPPIIGTNVLATYAPGYAFAGNTLGLDGGNASNYPSGNFFPATRDALGLTGYALPASSPYAGKATDGGNPGADVTQLLQLTSGVN